MYPSRGRWEGEDHQEGHLGIVSSYQRRETLDLYLEQRRGAKPRKQEERERGGNRMRGIDETKSYGR